MAPKDSQALCLSWRLRSSCRTEKKPTPRRCLREDWGKVEEDWGKVEGDWGKVEGDWGKVEEDWGKVEGVGWRLW